MHADTLSVGRARGLALSSLSSASRSGSSPATMPIVLLIIPILYYMIIGAVILFGGHTWEGVQQWLGDNNWVTIPLTGDAPVPFWEVRYSVIAHCDSIIMHACMYVCARAFVCNISG